MRNLLLLPTLLFLFSNSLSAQLTRTICDSGCDYTTIQAAVNAALPGDFLEILDAVTTESEITINISLSICGSDPSNIVQAAASPGNGSGRIFIIGTTAVVTINDLVLQNGSVSSNLQGGAIYNSGTLNVNNCTFKDNNANRGGAISSSGIGALSIAYCTFSNNTVTDDPLNPASGAALFLGTLTNTIVNSTFSGNQNNTTIAGTGGAITLLNGSALTLTHVTVAFNNIGGIGAGAGLAALAGSNLSLINSIIANNTGAEDLRNEGTLLLNTTNIVLTCSSMTDGCGTFITNDPALIGLANNGGCSLTHDLGGPSAAIDAGTATAFTFDQRGQARSLPNPDIGAVELSASTPACVGSILCINGPLPVELVYFQLKPKPKQIDLVWQTASEIANEGFLIMKSNDGRTWDPIGFVKGKGDSEEVNNYIFTDNNPRPGTNYYKLRQIDFDGTFSDSEIRSATFDMEDTMMMVFPNPVSEELTIQFNEEKSGQLFLTDFSGQVLMRKNLEQLPHLVVNAEEEQLAPGMYWLRFYDRNGTVSPEVHSFVVLKRD
jgi:Secretion system C-terminal sorting domain